MPLVSDLGFPIGAICASTKTAHNAGYGRLFWSLSVFLPAESGGVGVGSILLRVLESTLPNTMGLSPQHTGPPETGCNPPAGFAPAAGGSYVLKSLVHQMPVGETEGASFRHGGAGQLSPSHRSVRFYGTHRRHRRQTHLKTRSLPRLEAGGYAAGRKGPCIDASHSNEVGRSSTPPRRPSYIQTVRSVGGPPFSCT